MWEILLINLETHHQWYPQVLVSRVEKHSSAARLRSNLTPSSSKKDWVETVSGAQASSVHKRGREWERIKLGKEGGIDGWTWIFRREKNGSKKIHLLKSNVGWICKNRNPHAISPKYFVNLEELKDILPEPLDMNATVPSRAPPTPARLEGGRGSGGGPLWMRIEIALNLSAVDFLPP